MRQILDRFYQGETTIDEEQRLIAMLLSDDCPMDLKAERHAVIMLARQETISVPGDLEERVLGVIKPQAININRYKWFAAAAVAMLLVGIALWTNLPKPESLTFPQTSAKAEPIMATPEQSLSENPVITKGRLSCYNKRTVPLLHEEQPIEKQVDVLHNSSSDTIDSAVPTEKEQPQPIHEKAMPAANTNVVYPSEFHQRKLSNSRLTAKVYMSNTLGNGQTESLNPHDYNTLPISTLIIDGDEPVLIVQSVYHRQPVRFGLSLRYRLDDRWSVESGLSYTRLSSDITFTTIDGKITTTEEQRLNYFGLPLNISYDIWRTRHFGLYLMVGAIIEKCLDTSSWQFSLNTAAGAEYKLTDFFSLYAEPGLGYYFKDNNSTPTIYQDHPLNLNLSFGLRFHLK